MAAPPQRADFDAERTLILPGLLLALPSALPSGIAIRTAAPLPPSLAAPVPTAPVAFRTSGVAGKETHWAVPAGAPGECGLAELDLPASASAATPIAVPESKFAPSPLPAVQAPMVEWPAPSVSGPRPADFDETLWSASPPSDLPVHPVWESFVARVSLSRPLEISVGLAAASAVRLAGPQPLLSEEVEFAPSLVDRAPVPEAETEAEPVAWPAAPLPFPRLIPHHLPPILTRVRVKDFEWPSFAAGCESLFTPDQPFRFHELPFPRRGTTDTTVGESLNGEIIQELLLPYADDRFDAILHPSLEAKAVSAWLNETAVRFDHGVMPLGAAPVAEPVLPASPPPPTPPPSLPKTSEPPASWQQAARAMYEGEQQVPREPLPPAGEAKTVTAVPVVSDPEPLTGLEMAPLARPHPPIPRVKSDPPRGTSRDRSPASDQPQFEWRREQPQSGPAPPSGDGGSTVSVNTTIVVDGQADGVVVENAIRVSLGNRKKSGSAIEKFAEGEDLGDSRLEMAPAEGLPDFQAESPELRAILQPIAALAESIQWPKFSVMPMRRRIAFGPPARLNFFGASNPQPGPKPPSPDAKPLPPKKSVGFLFKRLTNS